MIAMKLSIITVGLLMPALAFAQAAPADAQKQAQEQAESTEEAQAEDVREV